MTLKPSNKCLVVDSLTPWIGRSSARTAGAIKASGAALRRLLLAAVIPLVAAWAAIGWSAAAMAPRAGS